VKFLEKRNWCARKMGVRLPGPKGRFRCGIVREGTSLFPTARR